MKRFAELSPLHKSVESMDSARVNELVAQGVDVNQIDIGLGGFTALHLAIDIECELACRENDFGQLAAAPISFISKLLLEAGANPKIPDFQGFTAIDLAKLRIHDDFLAVLSELSSR